MRTNCNYNKIIDIQEFNSEEIIFNYEKFNSNGFNIITELEKITLYISNEINCCEDFGYFLCNDDYKNFIGSDLYNIKISDSCLNEKILKSKITDEYFSDYLIKNDHRISNYGIKSNYEGNILFVDFETSSGVLQFVAYNGHNGYCSHDAGISSIPIKFNKKL